PRPLPSFPTRRSSDLRQAGFGVRSGRGDQRLALLADVEALRKSSRRELGSGHRPPLVAAARIFHSRLFHLVRPFPHRVVLQWLSDRKSTRLNSSHVAI